MQPSQIALTWRLVGTLLRSPARTVFLCHYNYPPVFVAALAARLSASSDEDMLRPIQVGQQTRTVAERLFFLYFHETYHTGQTELLRQLTGKNDKVI